MMMVAPLFLVEKLKLSHKPGRMSIPDGRSIRVEAILFDSGAEGDNYVSGSWVEQNNLQEFLQPVQRNVVVADGKKTQLTHKVAFPVSFMDDSGVEHVAHLDFMVFPGMTKEVIIGFKDMVLHFSKVFAEIVNFARDVLEKRREQKGESVCEMDSEFCDGAVANVDTGATVSDAGDLVGYPVDGDERKFVEPWINPVDEVAEEESSLPDPATFGGFHFMEVPTEVAQEEFRKEVPNRIDPEFGRKKPVLRLLLLFMSVFVATEWTGIVGIPLLKFNVRDGIPDRIKPRRVFVHKKYQEAMVNELERLKKYHLRPSDSPYASPLVVAPKATYPFIRLCADYRIINKWILCPQFPIPDVRKELEKASGFTIYCDLDMSNAFHNIRLDPLTSTLLSIQCPTEQLEPMFMPEGCSPASGVLMSVVYTIFEELDDCYL